MKINKYTKLSGDPYEIRKNKNQFLRITMLV